MIEPFLNWENGFWLKAKDIFLTSVVIETIFINSSSLFLRFFIPPSSFTDYIKSWKVILFNPVTFMKISLSIVSLGENLERMKLYNSSSYSFCKMPFTISSDLFFSSLIWTSEKLATNMDSFIVSLPTTAVSSESFFFSFTSSVYF